MREIKIHGKKGYDDITIPINNLIAEVNQCLAKSDESKYFQNIALLYSFHENLLKWMVAVQILWDRSDSERRNSGEINDEENKKMKIFFKSLTFYQAQNLALSLGVIDLNLYKQIEQIRKQRNDILHDLWLFEHRNDNKKLRIELENIANITNDLIQVFNELTEEIGVDEVYGIIL